MKIGITFAVYNNIALTEKCLDSIIGRNESEIYIVVVDNASKDSTKQILKGNYPQVKVLRNSENLGCSKAWNRGINDCLENDCDYIALTQNDVMHSVGCFDTLAKFLDNNQHFGVVSPICVNNREINLSINEFDKMAEFMVNRHKGCSTFPFLFYTFMGRKNIFEICKFDENYKIALYEDNDFYNQLYENNILSGSIGEAFIWHKWSSTQAIVRNPNITHNNVYFHNKWRDRNTDAARDALYGLHEWVGTKTMDKYPGCVEIEDMDSVQ